MYNNKKRHELLDNNQIYADVVTIWSDPRCKFQPNDKARLNPAAFKTRYVATKTLRTLKRNPARVIAVSVGANGCIRGSGRQYTRYYVARRGKVFPVESHLLSKVRA